MHCRYGQFAFSGLFGIVFSRSDSRTQIMLCVVCACVWVCARLACLLACLLEFAIPSVAYSCTLAGVPTLRWDLQRTCCCSCKITTPHPLSGAPVCVLCIHAIPYDCLPPAPRARTHDQHRDTLPLFAPFGPGLIFLSFGSWGILVAVLMVEMFYKLLLYVVVPSEPSRRCALRCAARCRRMCAGSTPTST